MDKIEQRLQEGYRTSIRNIYKALRDENVCFGRTTVYDENLTIIQYLKVKPLIMEAASLLGLEWGDDVVSNENASYAALIEEYEIIRKTKPWKRSGRQ